LKCYIVIPAHNEEQFLGLMLESVVRQNVIPNKVLVVNDHSTDNTEQIIDTYTQRYSFIEKLTISSAPEHMPGSKVVHAFHKGLDQLDTTYDLIGKFDADLILPEDYFEKMLFHFKKNKDLGMCSGLLYIKENNEWMYEPIAEKSRVRGPVKLYSKECFQKIGGLRPSIGWDSVDELLARYHGFTTYTDVQLKVKHLRPTGKGYTEKARRLQGEAMYKMRYGFLITLIASLKMAWKLRSSTLFMDNMKGFIAARKNNIPFTVTKDEGAFIRSYRFKGMLKKLRLF